VLFSNSLIYRAIYAALRFEFLFHRGPVVGKLLYRERPDAVIATSFYPAFYSKMWKRRFSLKYKIFGALVDFVVSPAWRITIDGIFTANESSCRHLRNALRNFSPCHPTGIPVPLGVKKSLPPLSRRKDVLLTGGGWGLGKMDILTGALLSNPDVNRLIVIFGGNEELREKISRQFSREIDNGRLLAAGLVEDMSVYYRNARVLVTKAGGVTLSEAACYGTPIVISSALPGHEEGNRRLFKDANACITADTPQEISEAVSFLLGNSDQSKRLAEKASGLVNPDSTTQIASLILREMERVDA
jgi:UDP-N-acetylglucosamine:LPS N-acetylglucosamine transferase